MSNALAQREVVGVDARASLAGVKRSSEPRTSVLRARVDDFDSASSAGDDERHRNGLAAAVRASRRPVRPGAGAPSPLSAASGAERGLYLPNKHFTSPTKHETTLLELTRAQLDNQPPARGADAPARARGAMKKGATTTAKEE